MPKERILHGIPASKGVGIGKAFIYEIKKTEVFQTPILSVYLKDEVVRFENAILKTKEELQRIKDQINREIGEDFGQFLDAQIMMLEDETILDAVKKRIFDEKKNAEYIYHEVISEYARKLSESKNAYFKERVIDIYDVAERVIKNLLGLSHTSVLEAPPGSVIIAHDIPPSEATLINRKNVVGIAMELGGRTSHTAITARALEIPAILGIGEFVSKVQNGDDVIVDGERGIVIIHPGSSRVNFYEEQKKKTIQVTKALLPVCELPPETRDGKHIDISANIEFFAEAEQAIRYGAIGIGLFRTEFLYLARRGSPSEEEQFRVYNALARKIKPHPVIIRTFDLGGDKIFSDYHEANPFLGWRAIRVCLQEPEFFKTQMRAILRASVNKNIRIMFPMIATYEEIRRVKLIFNEVKQELKSKKIEFDDSIQLGIMVETPSAALMSSSLAQEVDFFSIGSNDLTQYTLAVDRGNEKISQLFDHFHPAVLRLIKETIDSGHKGNIWVGICGELASDPIAIPLLVGLGIDELSMSPSSIPRAKLILRTLTIPQCKEIAEEALRLRTALEVRRFLNRVLRKQFPGIEDAIK
ncbi:MAG: phosphoenolpyruvate--protein phosphotransferase [candidate division WOR-3 bacterium]|nr:phosphoenolpyruvate--protein phosphotransferase [candidate division WOR-3 bacterium]